MLIFYYDRELGVKDSKVIFDNVLSLLLLMEFHREFNINMNKNSNNFFPKWSMFFKKKSIFEMGTG